MKWARISKKIRCFIKWAKSSVLGQFQKFFRDFYFMVKICFLEVPVFE